MHTLKTAAAFTAMSATLLSLAACASMQAGMQTTARPETVIALTESNRLIRFNAGQPDKVTAGVPLTGLAPNEQLLGIDFRPANGMLYGLGSSGQLYTVDPSTGAATAVGSGGFASFISSDMGFDFNPVVDRIRVVNGSGQNLRLHPDTGAVIDADANTPGTQIDGALSFAASDANAGKKPMVISAAYTNSMAGAKATTNYVLDAANMLLAAQGSVQGAATPVSPNTGQLFTIGSLGQKREPGSISFDISPANAGLVTVPNGKQSRLLAIDLSNGQTTSLGKIGVDEQVRAIAIAP